MKWIPTHLAALLLAGSAAAAGGVTVSEPEADALLASCDAARRDPREAARRCAEAASAYSALAGAIELFCDPERDDLDEWGECEAAENPAERRLRGKQRDAERRKCDAYESAADAGDPWGLHLLGLCFTQPNGLGRDKDNARGMRSFKQAADMGYARAMFELGWQYRMGDNVTQDLHGAAQWFLRVAEGGDHDAMSFLASMYAKGQGVPRDPSESARWRRKARAR